MAELRREDPAGVEVPLPSLQGLSHDDEAFLRAMLGFAETGAMFRGRSVAVGRLLSVWGVVSERELLSVVRSESSGPL